MFPDALLKERGYTFISNGIDTKRFHFDASVRKAVRQELGIEDKFVIGNVGRFCYQKNQTFLLDVLAKVLEKHSESCLLLVGDGEDRQMLEEKAVALGIRKNVIFYGISKEVERLFWAMDVFVFPSYFEGLGIVAVEAQAAGLPVICSERVPEEANVTEMFHKSSLEQGAARWCEVILNMQEQSLARAEGSAEVRNAGFDVDDVSNMIFRKYVP